MKENRVKLAMEASGVSREDLLKAITVVYRQLAEAGKEYLIVRLTDSLIDNGIDDVFNSPKEIKAIAKLCNCSTDYLLGLSNVMHPVGN